MAGGAGVRVQAELGGEHSGVRMILGGRGMYSGPGISVWPSAGGNGVGERAPSLCKIEGNTRLPAHVGSQACWLGVLRLPFDFSAS